MIVYATHSNVLVRDFELAIAAGENAFAYI